MSQEQPIATVNSQIKWNKKKISFIIIIIAIFCLTGSIAFHFAAAKVRQAAEQSLLAQANETINGKIIVGSIDLSILGYVDVKEVQVLDEAGNQLAKINRVHINYNWNDLLKGRLGPQMIKEVIAEKPEVWVAYHQNRLNWDGLFKTKAEQQSGFSGQMKIQDGKLNLETDLFEKSVDQMTGIIDLQQENPIVLSATGKLDKAAIKMDGKWGAQGSSEITLSAERVDLAQVGLTTADDPIQLTGGIIDELTLKIGKDDTSGATILKTLAGSFSGVTTTGVLELTQGCSQFEKRGDSIQFMNSQALYQGQTVMADGQVLTAPSGEKSLDFAVQMPAGNPAVLLSSLQAGGVLAAQGQITGSVLAPVFSGSFTLDSLHFGNVVISGINGTFSYTQQTLKLLTSRGAAIGGSVAASGDIYPDTQQYVLSISGNGLDTSQLTEKDVKGPLSLSGTATGSPETALLQGNFTIYDGKAYGISFRNLTGSFVKRGASEAEVSNLAIKTDLGVFYPEQLNQSVMEKLHERNLPTTSAALKERVTEKVAEKIFEKLFR